MEPQGKLFFYLSIHLYVSKKDDYLENKFNNIRNQVDDKIAWRLGGVFIQIGYLFASKCYFKLIESFMQDPIFPYSSISLLDRIELKRERKCTNNLPIVFLVNSIDIVNEYKSFL